MHFSTENNAIHSWIKTAKLNCMYWKIKRLLAKMFFKVWQQQQNNREMKRFLVAESIIFRFYFFVTLWLDLFTTHSESIFRIIYFFFSRCHIVWPKIRVKSAEIRFGQTESIRKCSNFQLFHQFTSSSHSFCLINHFVL